MLEKTKQEKLDEKDVTDSKNFWMIKSSFSNKGSTFGEITLNEGGNNFKDQHEVPEIFNNFCGNIVKHLQLPLPPSKTVCEIYRGLISKYRSQN